MTSKSPNSVGFRASSTRSQLKIVTKVSERQRWHLDAFGALILTIVWTVWAADDSIVWAQVFCALVLKESGPSSPAFQMSDQPHQSLSNEGSKLSMVVQNSMIYGVNMCE